MSEQELNPNPQPGAPHVAVVAENSTGERLTALLRSGGAIFDDSPEVVVVDRAGSLPQTDGAGLIAIGRSDMRADVTLPEDFSPRELLLACQLLAQVVRLRRGLDEGAEQRQAWQQEASRDALTGLPNLRGWNEELTRRMTAARALNQPLCVAMLDLDYFKQVNDGWGHTAGDQLLVAAAAALRQSLRQDDFVARLGGDEFGLLLEGVDAANAAVVIERIRTALPARIAQVTPHVTSASVGYHLWQPDVDATPEALLEEADRARRQAKSHGRDRAVLR